MSEETAHWHLDKRVPLALIITLVGQIIVSIWWLANISYRIDTLEHKFSVAETLRDDVVTTKEKVNSIEKMVTRLVELRFGEKDTR